MKLKYTFEFVELDDNVVAVPVGDRANELHGVIKLNETGAEIIKLLRNGLSLEEIAKELSQTFSASRDALKDDAEKFIRELREMDVLE